MAEANLRQAEVRLKHARSALEDGDYAYSVRQAQEAVELSLKAALRAVGVEPPGWRDVGPILRREASRFPGWFSSEIGWMAFASRVLGRDGELAMYGDEERGIPPEDLFGREDAEAAVEWAERAHSLAARLLSRVRDPPGR